MSDDRTERGAKTSPHAGSVASGTLHVPPRRLLHIGAWVLLIGFYLLLAFAYVWPARFRNAEPAYVTVAWMATLIRTFLFHGGLLVAVFALAAACARSWRLFIATIPALLVTLGPALTAYWPWSQQEVHGETLTVMSANLRLGNRNTGPIIQEIEANQPDILLLQEYTSRWHEAMQEAVGGAYPHVRHMTREDAMGAAIYSRRPFVVDAEPYIVLGRRDLPQLRAVIEIDGHPVAVYNIHLIRPVGLANVTEHRLQFANLLKLAIDEPIPLIVGGDFNFTDRSPYAAALGRTGFVDAYSVGGWGRGPTWPVHSFYRWVPGIRLDHIYLHGGLTCSEARTGTGIGSDHRPVIARIGFGR